MLDRFVSGIGDYAASDEIDLREIWTVLDNASGERVSDAFEFLEFQQSS